MNDSEAIKTVLRELVGRIEDLQVNLVVTSGLVGHGTSYAAVQDAKSIAKPEIEKQYAKLRADIEAL